MSDAFEVYVTDQCRAAYEYICVHAKHISVNVL